MAPTTEFRVTVLASRCENKQRCLDVCPTEVFDMVNPTGISNPITWLKIRVHGGLVAVPSRESDCVGCMACVRACPEDAITVVRATELTQG